MIQAGSAKVAIRRRLHDPARRRMQRRRSPVIRRPTEGRRVAHGDVSGQLRPHWAAIIAAMVLLVAGCGGHPSAGGSPGAGAPPTSASVLGFSQCMRSHGVPEFPDPDSRGVVPKVVPQQVAVTASQLERAQAACGHLPQASNAQSQQTMSGMLDFARCMRAHGVRDWPDPSTDSNGAPVFDLRGQVNPDTPRMDAVSGFCSHLLRPAPGQNGAVLCNGIGEDGCHHYG